MAQVSVTLGNASYVVGCQDGQEGRVHQLAHLVEQQVDQVRNALAPASDAHALFLAALLMADEIQELRAKAVSEEDRQELEQARHLLASSDHETERLGQLAELVEKLVHQVSGETGSAQAEGT
ncbi:cell division protein ZapA [Oecophyllibacter saccharovorans]|uniref:Cell division protein ZapA n=1 Tax=Oecophyllibacter saccharovorans TaxID=2558360 RepID=A0A506UR72_9PROT|nr:cell division protein ZapA [Oecophyllibacter saccharovorans]TPW35845.1 cell division protein ZapA [Oecophyllibacter saccharovorans]